MILVTGFGPYKEDYNASGALVQSLADDLPDELVCLKQDLAFELIVCDDSCRETEHQTLERQLEQLLEHYRPRLCLFTGQAPSYNKVMIEKIATNCFMREVIDPERPAAYLSNLPGIEDLAAVLEAQAIPCGNSFYAGQHLCNHILFSSQYFAEYHNHRHQSGFIHIPVLPQQVITRYPDAPCLPLDMTRKALSLIISHVSGARQRSTPAQPVTGSGG